MGERFHFAHLARSNVTPFFGWMTFFYFYWEVVGRNRVQSLIGIFIIVHICIRTYICFIDILYIAFLYACIFVHLFFMLWCVFVILEDQKLHVVLGFWALNRKMIFTGLLSRIRDPELRFRSIVCAHQKKSNQRELLGCCRNSVNGL